jgi:membrane-associated phospholipid phosphatase
MFRFESVAAAYFILLALATPAAPVPTRRSLRGLAAAVTLAVLVFIASRAFSDDARFWLGHLYLIAGYWLPAMLTPIPGATRFEQWLREHDVRWRAFVRDPSPAIVAVLELAYLACYVIVPLGFVIVWINGTHEDIDRFWVAVLLSGFACYISLPWLVSRPPRYEVAQPSTRRGVAVFNAALLGKVSHQLNTFPSGHVAVAIAIALTVAPISRTAGLAFGVVAAGIGLGAALGRYHYGIDVVAGALVGAAVAFVV